ncbi:MAG: SLBB domain-containing protein [Candidatus Eisenbacteria sp.]|nr:SLBB domain-containing protein [Candidatus Eisenbacteria bacterium]
MAPTTITPRHLARFRVPLKAATAHVLPSIAPALLVATCALIYAACAPAAAQGIRNLEHARSLDIGREKAGAPGSFRQGQSSPRIKDSDMALEGAIDPSVYRLAPGDHLALSIWGATDMVLDLQVTADGSLVVPSVGVIQVDGISLSNAADLLRSHCAGPYPHSEISLTLVRPALLRIMITGLILAPGIYPLASTCRLGDLIELAGGLREGADSRAILIRGRDGRSRPCDFLAWTTDGLEEGNPLLYSGDRVHVPAASMRHRVRGIFSSANEQPAGRSSALDRPFEPQTRLVPSRSSDNLGFVLRAAGGLDGGFCDSGVWLIQAPKEQEAGTGKSWVPIDEIDCTPLEPGSTIDVPFCREWIAVGGAVMRPGLYPYLPGETVMDYVYAAGGPGPTGCYGSWKVTRPGSGKRHAAAETDTLAAGSRIWVPERNLSKISSWLVPIGTTLAVVVSILAFTK